MNADDENENVTFPVLVSQEADPETIALQENQANYELNRMQNALATLDDRSRDILQKRWLNENKVGLKELSAEYGVSMERIRQIENQALGKMKNMLIA